MSAHGGDVGGREHCARQHSAKHGCVAMFTKREVLDVTKRGVLDEGEANLHGACERTHNVSQGL